MSFNSGRTCAAFGCGMRKGTNLLSQVKLFNFPRDPKRRKQWEIAVRRKNWKANNSSQLCNLHFISGRPSADPLHPDYVPSVFSFKRAKPSSLDRYERHAKRGKTDASCSEGKPSLNKNHLDYVPNVFSLNAPKRKADMYEELMDRLKEKRHAMLREENAVKGKPSSDENLSDYVPDAFDFNTSEKTADVCEKEMNGSKEKHSVTKGNAVNYKRKGYRCVVPNCSSSYRNERISFHEIPCDNNRRILWLKAISRQGPSKNSPWIPSQYSVVCQKHFKEEDYIQYDNHYFIENKIRKLKRTAVPSLFLPKPSLDKIEAIYFKTYPSVKISDQQGNRNVDYISCSVPGCQSKFPKKLEHNINEKNILMFPMPHSDWLFNQWKEPLKGLKIELPRDGHICERHFLEKDIERYDRTKTPDGDIIEIRKKIPSLKPAAIPIKFLQPSYSVQKRSSEEELASQNSVRNLTDKTSLTLNSCDSGNYAIDSENDFSGDLHVNSIEEQISHKKKCLSYSELVKNIQRVKKPSKSWSVVCTDEFTIFASWNNKFIAEKRLVIESSSTVRVFLKDWEIEMTELVDLTTVDDVSLLLEKVESYSMDSAC